MSRIIIGIGGDHSGSGKTTVACNILRALRQQWTMLGIDDNMPPGPAAIKCSPDELYTSINDDQDVLGQPGKDTALMQEAGAARVLWVSATREDVAEAMESAINILDEYALVVVEGNSAIEVLKPHIVLFIMGAQQSHIPAKDSSRRVMAMADVVVHGAEVPAWSRREAAKFSRDDTEGYVAHVLSLIGGARE